MRAVLPLMLGLSLCVGPAQAQTAMPVHASYSVYAMGFRVAELHTVFTLGESNYRMDLSYETTGLIGALFRGWQNSSVSGIWSADRPAPLRFAGDGFWHGEARHILIDYQRGMPVIRTLVPPNEEERDPVAPGLQAGSIDTLSAMALLIRHVARTGRCEAQATTYDGRRLADIVAHTAGDQVLPASTRSIYAGPSLRCDFEGHLRAGFLHDDDKGEAQHPQHGSAWLAQAVPGGPPIPVELSFETRWFGPAMMYLTEAGVGAEASR